MIFYTSFSPSEEAKKRQKRALASWKRLKVPVISLNTKEEIEILKEIYSGVKFVPTTRTGEYLFGKPQVKINALLYEAYGCGDNIIALINSDIEIKNDRKIIDVIEKKAQEGLVIVSRYNYIKNYDDAALESWGIDIFAMKESKTCIIPERVYCMGQPCWDYWIPLCFMKEKLPIYQIVSPISFHQKHKGNWNDDSWNLTWRLLCDEKMVKCNTSIDVYNKINKYVTMDKPKLRERLYVKMKKEELLEKKLRKKETRKNVQKKQEEMEELMVVGSGKKLQRSVNKLLKDGWNIKEMNPRKQPIFSSNDIDNIGEVVKAIAKSQPVVLKVKTVSSIQNVCMQYDYMEVILTKE